MGSQFVVLSLLAVTSAFAQTTVAPPTAADSVGQTATSPHRHGSRTLAVGALGVSASVGINVVGDRATPTGSASGQLTLRHMGDLATAPGLDGSILHTLLLDVRANMVGFNGETFMSGGTGRFGGMIGGVVGGDVTREGCGFYVGASVNGMGRFGYGVPYHEGDLRLQPETGLVCRVNGVTFTIAPSSGVGTGFRVSAATNSRVAGMGFYGGMSAGGVMRLFSSDGFWLEFANYYTLNHSTGREWWTDAMTSWADVGMLLNENMILQLSAIANHMDRMPHDTNPAGSPTALIDSQGTAWSIDGYAALLTLF